MSRGSIPEGKFILHMCHRRSCIQPAHLYAGTRKQNADDRQTRLTEKGRRAASFKFFDEYESRMFDSLKYLWDEPPEIERTLFQQQTGEHRCEYTIPAGERMTLDGKVEETNLCQICFTPQYGWEFFFDDFDPQKEEAAYRSKYRQGPEWLSESKS